jgi:hypothetical protein
MLDVAYTTAEARGELLEAVAQAAAELAFAGTALTEAYDQLDEQSGDRLEAELFRPVQLASGRAQRAETEFAARHNLDPLAREQGSTGLPSQGAAGFVGRAAEAVAEADRVLAELQDSMLPVEAGDEQLRSALRAVREPLTGLPEKARAFLGGVGR